MRQIFAKKNLDALIEEMAGEHRLRRILGPVALTALGVGSIIGVGIFVLVGQAAHDKTGPAVTLSFVVAGITCVFAALCYAEFASMAPVAGSAYTYAYITLGELLAWIIGWDLILEYGVCAAAVANGWSSYMQSLLGMYNVTLPQALQTAPFDYDPALGKIVGTGSAFDLLSVLITLVVTVVLVLGIRESARFNATMVIVKLAAVLLVILIGAAYVDPENWYPFAPYGYTGVSFFGKNVLGQEGKGGEPLGMLAGAAIIFFAYIGFDSISTHAEEAKNPRRDVPLGIMASLAICTVLYVAMAAVLTGMVPYHELDVNAPVAEAFARVGLPWAQLVIAIGAIAGITSVLLVTLLSQPRVLLAMARDGLLPEGFFGAIHSRFHTPWKATLLTGVLVAIMAGLLPLRILAELVSIGTLLAFLIVCIAVLIMRRTNPEAVRPFRVPLVPFIPLAGIACCLMLMFSLPAENWWRLVGWLALGIVIYYFYSRKHSRLGKELRGEISRHGLTPTMPAPPK